MFTLAQIETAHSKVRSGADFPSYIQKLKQLGVDFYETFVEDGHTNYHGPEAYEVNSPATYATLIVASTSDASQFKSDLKAHQTGKTDYPTFCRDCAKSGIKKWTVLLDEMTCTYFDKAGYEVFVEVIPE